MRIHKALVAAAATTLESILVAGRQSEDAVAVLLKSNPKWGSRDRHFLAENIYDVVRHARWYSWLAGREGEALSQPLLADLIGVRLLLAADSPEVRAHWPHLDAEAILARAASDEAPLQVRESVPDWLHELGSEQLGDRWPAELHALNQPAAVALRVNTLIETRQSVMTALGKQNIACKAVEESPDAIVLLQKANLRTLSLYNEGWVEIQDVSSQQVAPLMELQPGLRVLDACAGAGGKTLHMAALMQNRGKILALDVSEPKLAQLQVRAKRARVRIVTTAKMEDSFAAKNVAAFDRVLLDVPCSSLGVMRRKPDLKWTLTREKLDEIVALQAKLLRELSACVKSGGLLTYSTCSILPMENEEQTSRFLAEHPNFEKVTERVISPAASGFDGFYICVMRRTS